MSVVMEKYYRDLRELEYVIAVIMERYTHTSTEHKWEYFDGVPFGSVDERDRVLIGLLYTCGFKHLIEILSEESIKELFKVVSDYNNKE